MTALFKSTHDALRFAYRFNGDNTVSARLGNTPSGNGRGLGGLDGAAQAGMIQAEVRQLGEIEEAVALAAFSIPGTLVWSHGIAGIVRHIVETRAIRFKARELCVYVVAYFNRKRHTQESMAQRLKIDQGTVSRHYREVSRYLGSKYSKGLCDDVMLRIDDEMRAKGVVGDDGSL
jgi:hypothetical protein